MTNQIHGLHHHHIRKRINKKHRTPLKPTKLISYMDKAIYVVGVFGPIMTLPQLYKIWLQQNASGVSLISWSAYLFTAISGYFMVLCIKKNQSYLHICFGFF